MCHIETLCGLGTYDIVWSYKENLVFLEKECCISTITKKGASWARKPNWNRIGINGVAINPIWTSGPGFYAEFHYKSSCEGPALSISTLFDICSSWESWKSWKDHFWEKKRRRQRCHVGQGLECPIWDPESLWGPMGFSWGAKVAPGCPQGVPLGLPLFPYRGTGPYPLLMC